MSSLFSRLFKSGGSSADDSADAGLDGRLAALEKQAEKANQGLRGIPLNTAGDRSDRAGDRSRALSYYGRAIDAFLEDAQPEAARGVARKIIRIHPEAVRTLCTLTWLDLGSSHLADALVHLNEYAAAAEKAGRSEIAREQILDMARTSAEVRFLEAAAMALERLEAQEGADQVREWARRDGGSEHAISNPVELLDRCLTAAVGTNARRDAEGAVA